MHIFYKKRKNMNNPFTIRVKVANLTFFLSISRLIMRLISIRFFMRATVRVWSPRSNLHGLQKILKNIRLKL
jgi:hypothetical protein